MRTLAPLVLVGVLAACGGSGEGFAEKAIAICEETNAEIRALGAPESFVDTQLYASRAKDAVADEIDALNGLSPPTEVADEFDLYLVTLEERTLLLERLGDAADERSINAIRDVGSRIAELDDTAREQAKKIGIEPCEPR